MVNVCEVCAWFGRVAPLQQLKAATSPYSEHPGTVFCRHCARESLCMSVRHEERRCNKCPWFHSPDGMPDNNSTDSALFTLPLFMSHRRSSHSSFLSIQLPFILQMTLSSRIVGQSVKPEYLLKRPNSVEWDEMDQSYNRTDLENDSLNVRFVQQLKIRIGEAKNLQPKNGSNFLKDCFCSIKIDKNEELFQTHCSNEKTTQ